MLLLFVLSRLANKFFKFNVVEQASVMYSNASYLVIPIISAILGPEWVIYTCGYVCCQTTFTWTHLVSLMSGENRISLKNIVRNLNLITVAIGMILFITQIRLPAMILDPISSIGSCVGAMSMLTLGMSLGNADFKEIFSNGKAMLVVVCKLIVFPIIITTVLVLIRLGRIFDGAQTVLLITVLTTASPTGVIVTQMAQLFDRDKEYAGIINVMGVIFAIFTMPFMAYYYLLLNGIIG